MTVSVMYWVVGGGVIVVCLVLALQAPSYMDVFFEQNGNDDDEAARRFKALIGEARENIIIHDDGDSTPSTLYNNPDVVDEVRAKLEAGVTVRCLFNKREDIAMVRLCKDFPDSSLMVRYMRSAPDCRRDIHFKIIDNGTKGILSKHCPGSRDRGNELIDATHSSPAVRKKLFGPFYDEFECGITTLSTQ